MITENMLTHFYIYTLRFELTIFSLKWPSCLYFIFFRMWHNYLHIKCRSFEIILDFSLILVSYQPEFLFLIPSTSQSILPPPCLLMLLRLFQTLCNNSDWVCHPLSLVPFKSTFYSTARLSWIKWKKKKKDSNGSQVSLQTNSTIVNWEITWDENLKPYPRPIKSETQGVASRVFVLLAVYVILM